MLEAVEGAEGAMAAAACGVDKRAGVRGQGVGV